ncbi:MAG: 6-phosphogluconolactonase [Candidatus Dormibacteria bacterium]
MRLPGATVRVFADSEQVAGAAASWLTRVRGEDPGRLDVALAGGSTPRRLYELLAAPPHRDEVDWSRWNVWFGDERAVPPADQASNYRMARDTLLSQVPIAREQVHRMPADRADLEAAAAHYGQELLSCLPSRLEAVPRLDVVLLGLGENGHTASLFPGDPSLAVRDRLCVPARADYAPYQRLTLTLPPLNAARQVIFMVSGANKGEALRAVRDGSAPAARVRPRKGELLWLLDEQAAEGLR